MFTNQNTSNVPVGGVVAEHKAPEQVLREWYQSKNVAPEMWADVLHALKEVR